MKIVYIMGRAHSGSTFLDVLIGHSKRIESVGEILSGLNRGEEEECSCGSLVKGCDYWLNVSRLYLEKTGRSLIDDGALLYKKSDIRNFIPYSLNMKKKDQREYEKINNDILTTISEIADIDCVVDSNKEYTRAMLLLKNNEESVVIHLYRDPIKLASSHYYRQRKGYPFKFMKKSMSVNGFVQPFIIAFLGFTWSIGMVLASYLNFRYGQRVINISYEQFCQNPDVALEKISKYAKIDLEDSIRGIKNDVVFNVGHNLGGNELRHNGGFRFIANSGGRREMPYFMKIAVAITSFPGRLLEKLYIENDN